MLRLLVVVLTSVSLVPLAHADVVDDAISALETLWDLRHPGGSEVEVESESLLRETVHAAHERRPTFRPVAEVSVTDPDVARWAPAVCAIVPDESVERPEGSSDVYLEATWIEEPGLLDLESGWALELASSGTLIEFVDHQNETFHAVLTAAHTATRTSTCGGTTGHNFVFGLTEYDLVERIGADGELGTWVRVPADHVGRTACALLNVETARADVALHYVDDLEDPSAWNPLPAEVGLAEPGQAVVAIGFPLGLPMRVTRGVVDTDPAEVSEDRFLSDYYAVSGMSGAPVFASGTLAGVHVYSWATSGVHDHLACPVPCAIRSDVDAFFSSSLRDCTDAGSWSTAAGRGVLASALEPIEIEVVSTVARSVEVALGGDAVALVLDGRSKMPANVLGGRSAAGRFVLRPGTRIALFTPPGSDFALIAKRKGARSGWRRWSRDRIREHVAKVGLVAGHGLPRLVIRDPSGGDGLDFDLLAPNGDRGP